MAVIKEHRNKDVGTQLLSAMIKHILIHKPKRIWLRSQLQAMLFYENLGFVSSSEPFEIYGKTHIDIEYPLDSPELVN